MSGDINQKREFVASLYPGKGWRTKVSKMPDGQVIAIYFKEKNQASDKSDKKKENNKDDIPF